MGGPRDADRRAHRQAAAISKATVQGSKADAIRKRDEIRRARARDRDAGAPAAALVRRGVARATRRHRLKRSTFRKYSLLIKHVIAKLGDHFVDSLVPSEIISYVDSRLAAGAAGNTVLNELRVLRVIARFGRQTRTRGSLLIATASAHRRSRATTTTNLLTPDQAGHRVIAHPASLARARRAVPRIDRALAQQGLGAALGRYRR